MKAAPWLTARAIAHRGLYAPGIGENSIAAATAAIAKCYAIECDVQCTKDGEAIVFHDFALDRLTLSHGDIGTFTAIELTRLAYRNGPGTIATLADFLAAIGGRVPVFIEIKSRFDADMRLAKCVTKLLSAYSGPAAVMSFDADILAECGAGQIPCPLGIVAQARYDSGFSETQRERLAHTDFSAIAPDFMAWRAGDLPHPVPLAWRERIPILAWTLRDAASAARAMQWADQIVFEGFAPAAC